MDLLKFVSNKDINIFDIEVIIISNNLIFLKYTLLKLNYFTSYTV